MKILVGSAAAKEYIDIERKPKDLDFFAKKEDTLFGASKYVETFYHPSLESWFGNDVRTATLNELYNIKLSHIFWDLKNNSWEKHAHDLMALQRAGGTLDLAFYSMLYSIWEEVHGKKKANLNALPEDFFNKQVERIWEHDSIHASIAYYSEPMFKKILRDGHPVLVDIAKWNALSLEDKYKTVREEVYATALERQLIPSDYTSSPRVAYQWALKKTITSFSKGWFPLFIATHLKDLWKPDIDYVKRHRANFDKLIKLGE